ncbi:MAG: hypothetical protein Q7S11_04850 [bacterium]|nr:hypothetical protein [bacterium]
MNERYIGTAEDQRYIRTYLENIRSVDPLEIATIVNPVNLSDSSIQDMVDTGLFWDIVQQCTEECFKQYGVQLHHIESSRYYIAEPPEKTEIGGFYDKHCFGYQYWYHAAFSVALNKGIVSKEVLAVELARGFLHDFFHHSTFRSFRRALRVPATSIEAGKRRVPEIYREQYGVNFRNQDGLSYSSPELTVQSPQAINLNVLMDGAIVLIVAESMKQATRGYPPVTKKLEAEIMKEVFLESFDTVVLPRAHKFFRAVTEPSRLFIEHWGGKDFVARLLQSMMSGELEELKNFFGKQACNPVAWENTFKRSEFNLST